jgi:hypothetical protein
MPWRLSWRQIERAGNEKTRVYADVSSAVIDTIHLDDYAKAIGRATGRFKVDVSVGRTGILQQGWIAEDWANLNGPCDGLPTLTP